MQVGDIVFTRNNRFNITGIYIGIEGQQNLVGLESLDQIAGTAYGVEVKEMLVPEELVLDAGVYRRVD